MYYLVLQVTDDALQAGTHGWGFELDIAREIDHNANASFLSFLPSFLLLTISCIWLLVVTGR